MFIPLNDVKSNMVKSFDEQLWEAENLLANGEFDKASKVYKKLLKEQPNDPKVHFGMAESIVLNPQGDIEKAIEHYSTAVKGDPENPMYHALFGKFLCDIGRFNDAEREYRAAAQTDTENMSDYMMELASSYIRIAPVVMEKFMNAETELIIKRKALGWALEALEISPEDAKKIL